MPVSVAKPVKRTVVETADFTGRFQAWPSVDIRSRVTGYLQSGSFIDGSIVREGDLLFTIDPRPFQAAVDQAAAQLKVAETKLDLARTNLQRAEELRKTGNVTEALYQTQQQTFLESQALVNAASAALAQARLDLEYSRIKAPTTGRISRNLVSPGNLVVANSADPLATIVSLDPLRFYFDMDEASYLAYRRHFALPDDAEVDPPQAKVALTDEKTFTRPSKLDYLDPQVDSATGTVTARAIVPNPDNFLTPGLFGRIRIATMPPYEGLVVPEAAIGTTAKGSYVVTVGTDQAAVMKPVELGAKFGPFRIVKKGLAADDQVIVNGLMRARPGGKVIPQPTELKVPENLSEAMDNPDVTR
jgi:RND family efflux transporter MFP subunit